LSLLGSSALRCPQKKPKPSPPALPPEFCQNESFSSRIDQDSSRGERAQQKETVKLGRQQTAVLGGSRGERAVEVRDQQRCEISGSAEVRGQPRERSAEVRAQ
jgi:hypothetical protein